MHQESLNITTFILHSYTRQSIMKEMYTMALWKLIFTYITNVQIAQVFFR